MSSASVIYQFRVELEHVKPKVWRQIQVRGDYTFWDLHMAIQDSMGWENYHLHEFRIENPQTHEMERIGMPGTELMSLDEAEVLCGAEVRISDYFVSDRLSAEYEYDFGDGWTHCIILEKTFDSVSPESYPRCSGGANACPPEDIGGPYGYSELLKAVKNPAHPQHEELCEWIDDDFDPTVFSIKSVVFKNPKKAWDQNKMHS